MIEFNQNKPRITRINTDLRGISIRIIRAIFLYPRNPRLKNE